jgi:TonB-linked SusC/RagA family outer membrane protein
MPELSNSQRQIRVYLPAGFDGGDASFAVVYLHDGHQLFTAGPSGHWTADETIDRLHETERLQGLIVVGIDRRGRGASHELGAHLQPADVRIRRSRVHEILLQGPWIVREAPRGADRAARRTTAGARPPSPQPGRLPESPLTPGVMMWRNGFMVVVASLLASAPVLAQSGSITGRVFAAEGEQPVPRVQVVVVGTGLGTLTRDDGRYTIASVPAGTYTVRAQRIGLTADSARGVVVTPGGVTTTNFHLRASAVALGAVVTVGYGTQESRDRTGSIETVTERDFNTGRIVSPEQLIQAKVPGVQVVESNEPGAGISLRIRGGTSVTSSNEPLFVIDNVPLTTGGGTSAGRNPLNFLNPDDIESITVLKDASATAIYGSRGANGVVLITTKSGAAGSQVSLITSVSTSRVTGGPSMLDAAQYRQAVTQYAPGNLAKIGTSDTDWRKLVQRSGLGQDHSLAFAGSRSDLNYRLSLGYLDQAGVISGSQTKRMSTAMNYNDKLLNQRLELQASIKGTRNDDKFTPSGVIGSATAFAPTLPLYTATGAYYEYTDPLGPNNPLSQLALTDDKGTTYRSIGNIQAKYKMPFLDGLSGTVNLGYDVARAERTTFLPSTEQSQLETSSGGSITRKEPSQNNTVLDAYANYTHLVDRLQSFVDLTAGYSYEHTRGDSTSFYSTGLASDLLGPNGVPAARVVNNSIFIDENKLVSTFARLNYTLRDKYLVTLSVRRDGSSKFGKGHEWGVFPSAAFAWRAIDEGFMKRLPMISDLKLRVSYGVNGNQAFPSYRSFSDYVIGGPQAQVQFGNVFVTTIRPSAADPAIHWEQTKSTNVGVDYGVLDNRVTGTIDYYTKKTDDLIFNVPVAAGTNLSNYVTTNIGSLENHGLELGVNTQVFRSRTQGFSWDANFNAATNTNKLLHINAIGAGSEQILTGGIAGGVGSNIEVLQPGYPINSFFVYRHKRDGSGNPIYADMNNDGTINEQDLYEDLNGDKIVDIHDRAPFHSPAPKWILGHSSLMSYGNWDASTTIRAYLGNYVYNNVASNLGNYSAVTGNNPVNLQSSVLTTQFVNPQYFSDVYVEDASFLRMDNLNIGYTFRTLRNVRQMRVFGTIQNVFTTTKYSGVDPTSGVNGIDNNIFPRSRTFVAGANFVF